MHADHAHAPVEDETQRAIVLSREQFARLTAFLRAGFQRDSAGRTMPLIGRGYSSNDMFYEVSYNYMHDMPLKKDNEYHKYQITGIGIGRTAGRIVSLCHGSRAFLRRVAAERRRRPQQS